MSVWLDAAFDFEAFSMTTADVALLARFGLAMPTKR
jgi:hypothetical protein